MPKKKTPQHVTVHIEITEHEGKIYANRAELGQHVVAAIENYYKSGHARSHNVARAIENTGEKND